MNYYGNSTKEINELVILPVNADEAKKKSVFLS